MCLYCYFLKLILHYFKRYSITVPNGAKLRRVCPNTDKEVGGSYIWLTYLVNSPFRSPGFFQFEEKMFGANLQKVGREPEIQANKSENYDNTLQNRRTSHIYNSSYIRHEIFNKQLFICLSCVCHTHVTLKTLHELFCVCQKRKEKISVVGLSTLH